MKKESTLHRTAAALGKWQTQIVTKHVSDKTMEEIPHPAAAPMSTDQEAGGSSSPVDADLAEKSE